MLAAGEAAAVRTCLAPISRPALASVGLLAEIEIEAARRRLRLALVLAARLPGPVGVLDGTVHAHERDLPDRHAVVDRDRQGRQVGELQGQVSLEARIDEPGGAVGEEAEPPERGLS